MQEGFLSPEEVTARLKKLTKMMEQMMDDFKDELSFAQARIVFPIMKNRKGYSATELAEIAKVDKALVSRTIADLELKGIVERNKDAGSNERNYKIVLTEKGQCLFAEMRKKHDANHKKWRSRFTYDQLRIFQDVLVMLTDEN